nr:DUF3160 domain-containing protein [uncultured Carboxylicivirga sp.]
MNRFLLIVMVAFLCSCGGKKSSTKEKQNKVEVKPEQPKKQHLEKSGIIDNNNELIIEALKDSFDLNFDISQLSLSDVRILRNSFAAKQGYCFMKADLRGVFGTTSWYNQRMEDRFWSEEEGSNDISPIEYSIEEQDFIDKLRAREDELISQNYIVKDETTKPNINNIINIFQLESAHSTLMSKLANNGFAIVPNSNIQLFHVYEQNDYQQFPSFVTTDMYMQLFHMYFGYLLRTTEEQMFIPLLQDICYKMYLNMNELALNSTSDETKRLAAFNSTYYAIAYSALLDTNLVVPSAYQTMYKAELKHIEDVNDDFSEFLGYTDVYFPYSIFKPRGHYTRNNHLKKYFKAMMWLQTAPFCLDDDTQLKCATLSVAAMNKTGLFKKYKAILEPLNFIIGQPDNISFQDIADVLQKTSLDAEFLMEDTVTLGVLRYNLQQIAKSKNRIKPKQAISCVDKINFMPQRYLSDNEILQELVDVQSSICKRPFPKGLDVMAAFGSESAKKLIQKEENESWELYPEKLSALQKQMSTVNWDKTVYNKWIYSLLELQKKKSDYPYFMQSYQWEKKNLNSSLASWAELKHDAILYAEQPMAAECGGGGPPEPITVGYVEPNTAYWNAVIELLDLTSDVFQRNGIYNESISRVTTQMKENAKFLLSVSQKELKGENLTNQEYGRIEYIGSTFEWITLDLVKEENQYLEGWHNVEGPDKSVAVVADIYTSNAENNPDPGVLHVATGNVNDIYVVVEIEGYLYLTKGAVFSYYEFSELPGNRLTDEEWQSRLERNMEPEMPHWMKEIMVPIAPPKTNQKIFYSSGC